jgi:Zn-dependent protease
VGIQNQDEGPEIMDFMAILPKAMTMFVAMLLSLCVHEAAHALSAKWCGDRTAERLGRLTLNPMAHADPLGTIILPLIGFLAQLPVLGWAKPVPVDERNFRRAPRLSHAFVSAAGPASNLLICLLSIIFLTVHQIYLNPYLPKGSFFYPLVNLAEAMVWVNAILAVFNLIPLPPLDGAAVLQLLLPADMAEAYERVVGPYGYFILLVLMISGALGWVSQLAKLYVQFCSAVVGQLAGLVLVS